MLISEIYHSRQGEGRLAGTPSVFVRTSGCNLRCEFCDTPFASWRPTGESMKILEIVEQVQQAAASDLPAPLVPLPDFIDASPISRTQHVVLTGGEPLLPKDCTVLCSMLAQLGFHITIETAGTVYRPIDCDLISISPKLSNSDPSLNRSGNWLQRHQQTRYRPDVAAQFIADHDYQFKFVVASPEDIDEIIEYLQQIPSLDRSRVMLMPEGTQQTDLADRESWLRNICRQHGFQICPRYHILWYGNKRAT